MAGRQVHGKARCKACAGAERGVRVTLGRGKAKARKTTSRGGGRQPNTGTMLLRQKLAQDKEAGALRDATHYVRWLVDQPGANVGLKGARPIVYRELCNAKR